LEKKSKNDLKIKSKTPLNRLFQIYIEKGSPKKLHLLFVNEHLDPSVPPTKKIFEIEKPQNFIIELTEELSKLDIELKLQYSPEFH